MNTIVRTDIFDAWLSGLKDAHGKARIIKRIRSAERDNFGDCESFDASDYLDSEEVITEYLTVALEDPDPDAFLMAVRDVAKTRGIATVAANAGLGRESLYKTLKPGAQPRFETVRRLLDALGVRLGTDKYVVMSLEKHARLREFELDMAVADVGTQPAPPVTQAPQSSRPPERIVIGLN